ncbi:MAG: VOC family protein [candidate division Zixibacteria bacterium]|nr:VOC family protein [candidate division Zixibacteria bacterium]
MPRILGVLETSLYVNDLKKSVEFYQQLFGFKNLGSGKRMAALRICENQVLLLFKRGGSVKPTNTSFGTIPPTDGEGNLHLTFAVYKSEFIDWDSLLRKMNISIESSLEWPEGGRSIYFRDPDEHLLELKTADWDSDVEFEKE